MLEPSEKELGELLNTARPAPLLSEGWQARAMEGMGATRRAARSRRLITVAVGAAVALFGLGFVPIPTGQAKGALNKAMAALGGTTGLYQRYHRYEDGKETVVDLWMAAGALMRKDEWQNGRLVSAMIWGPDTEVWYRAETKRAEVSDAPPPHSDVPPPSGDALARAAAQAATGAAQHRGEPGVTVKEWRERSLWAGEVNVIEMTTPASGGEMMKRRWETDPATGHLLSEKVWQGTDGNWRLTQETEKVQWGEIPDDVWDFVPPKGTTVTYTRWWSARLGEPIASGETEHWRIVLYAVEANKRGDLVLTLSRWPQPEHANRTWNGAVPVAVDGVDNLGVTYSHTDGYGCDREYWTTTLQRGQSPIVPGHARTVTLTVRPYPDEGLKGESLAFTDVPMPPLQEKVEPETEVVQY